MAKTVDERRESKLVRELRKENIRLRKEVKQLRKQSNRTEQELGEFRSSLEDEVVEEVEYKNRKIDPKCPKCDMSKGMNMMVLRGTQYYKCDNCNSKGKYLNPLG